MRLDVVALARFYNSPLGAAARTMIARRVAAAWPDVSGRNVLGLGYATPFLEPMRGKARRLVAAMPAAQGVERWRAPGGVGAVLLDEARLPFREAAFDRAVLAHQMEEADALIPCLRELWRALSPEGRVMIIAASRRGLWSRLETSPFGHGRSFTRAQLKSALRAAGFEPVAWARALYAPPIGWSPFMRSASAWERVGERLWSRLGGVILVEAAKRVAAPVSGLRTPAAAAVPVRAPAPARPFARGSGDDT